MRRSLPPERIDLLEFFPMTDRALAKTMSALAVPAIDHAGGKAEIRVEPLVRFFMRAKHWQVFLIFTLLWLAAVVAMIVPMLRSPQEALDNLLPFFAAMELVSIFFALWLSAHGPSCFSIFSPFDHFEVGHCWLRNKSRGILYPLCAVKN